MMQAKRLAVAASVIVTLVLATSRAEAQVCFGVPLNQGQTALALQAYFPSSADVLGARIANQISAPVTVAAAYRLTNFENIDDAHTVAVEAALDIPISSLAQSGIGFCPFGELAYRFWTVNSLAAEVGVGVGGILGVSDGISVAPTIRPKFTWVRQDSEANPNTSTDFGFEGGANLIVENLYFGVILDKIGDLDATFGVQAGMIF